VPDWRAVAALVLAVGAAVAIVILAWSEADHQIAGHISEAESTLLATVLGAMVGAVATFLGMRNGRHD
jgi:predicted membrane-bound mannosyltransferase